MLIVVLLLVVLSCGAAVLWLLFVISRDRKEIKKPLVEIKKALGETTSGEAHITDKEQK